MTRLVVGRHTLDDVHTLLEQYRLQVPHGPSYYAYRPTTDPDRVTVEDLGLAVLFGERPRSQTAQTLVYAPVDVSKVPSAPLHETSAAGRALVVDTIMELVGRPASDIASSLATKMLHKKRPATVPVLDDAAIFATFCSDPWQRGVVPPGEPVRDRERVADALDRVHTVVSDPANATAWEALEHEWPKFTRIELLDRAWWAYVRCLDIPDASS